MRGGGLLINAGGVEGPDVDLVGQREGEFGRARLDDGAAGGEAPALRRVFGHGGGQAGALGAAPASLRRTGMEAGGSRVLIPCEGVSLGTAPGAQMEEHLRRAPGHDGLTVTEQRALYQQMGAFIEAEVAQIYAHGVNRSSAALKAA